MDSLRGQLLVAAPTLLDPNFARTVVVVAEHDDEGALGLVLNRRTDTTVADAVADLEPLAVGESVHVGGPVAKQAVVLLCRYLDPDDAGLLVFDDVGLPAADADLDDLAPSVQRARVFAGHAGWGPGQLEAEVEQDGWIVAPARVEQVFTDEPEGLWGSVLEAKGGRFALLARMPVDPSVN